MRSVWETGSRTRHGSCRSRSWRDRGGHRSAVAAGLDAGPDRPPVLTAAFTTVSAVCVTGLTTVDTATYWSPFGQAVIMALIQVGGFGIMTLATLLGMLVGGKLRLKSSLIAQAETHTLNIGDVRHVVRRVAVTMLAFEAAFAPS